MLFEVTLYCSAGRPIALVCSGVRRLPAAANMFWGHMLQYVYNGLMRPEILGKNLH
jgi:hypothetical protein